MQRSRLTSLRKELGACRYIAQALQADAVCLTVRRHVFGLQLHSSQGCHLPICIACNAVQTCTGMNTSIMPAASCSCTAGPVYMHARGGLGAAALMAQLLMLLHGLCSQALEELNVADNAITKLPSSLVGLSRLKQLTLYGNELSALSLELVRMPSLQGAALIITI